MNEVKRKGRHVKLGCLCFAVHSREFIDVQTRFASSYRLLIIIVILSAIFQHILRCYQSFPHNVADFSLWSRPRNLTQVFITSKDNFWY